MNAAPDGKRRTDLLEFFCRHLVGLCVTYRHKSTEDADQPARFTACSGTLIMIRGAVLFLTAGHVLKSLEELRTHHRVEIIGAALADTLGWKRVSDVPIPFDLMNARLFYIDDKEEGLDFGVIVLERNYTRLLAKNGVVALMEENWVHQHTVRYDGYAMLGFPEEFTSERVSVKGDGVISPVMFRVKKLQSAPEGRSLTRHMEFVGQLDPGLPLSSVRGMSGGPIFGFKLKPKPRYWIVALQSSWNPNKRIVYGCVLPVLASLMTKWTEEWPPAVRDINETSVPL